MFYILLTILPIVLLKSPTLRPLMIPSLMGEMNLVVILLCKELCYFTAQWLRTTTLSVFSMLKAPARMPARRVVSRGSRPENVDRDTGSPVLDLPELALDTVLERLPPEGLCNMAAVCRSLRDRCRGDRLWERHMEEKWGRVLGEAARHEWHCYVASRQASSSSPPPPSPSVSSSDGKVDGWVGLLPSYMPSLPWLRSSNHDGCSKSSSRPLHADSVMAWFLELESGRFWFPAQVYNRENGHIGFLLSCYDAQVSYDRNSNTFHARYPPHGRRATIIEDRVSWDRIRVPPVAIPPHNLHISDCLSELHPGDHIEIQWRRTKEFPYGWWYGMVGHLESCDRSEHHCNCHKSDTVIIDFKQYAPGSQWRHAAVHRKDHQEEGNEIDGFYGGIRKISNTEEISSWRKVFPSEMFE